MYFFSRVLSHCLEQANEQTRSLSISLATLCYFSYLFYYLMVIVPWSWLDQLLQNFFISWQLWGVLLKTVWLSKTLIFILMTHLLGEFAVVSQHWNTELFSQLINFSAHRHSPIKISTNLLGFTSFCHPHFLSFFIFPRKAISVIFYLFPFHFKWVFSAHSKILSLSDWRDLI